ncbi:hypothetical protein Gotur_030888 [Gossypium turneri]
MATIRFEIEKFDGVTNFNLWQLDEKAFLQSSCASRIRYCRRYGWRRPYPPCGKENTSVNSLLF